MYIHIDRERDVSLMYQICRACFRQQPVLLLFSGVVTSTCTRTRFTVNVTLARN